jgi:hypothetical protein
MLFALPAGLVSGAAAAVRLRRPASATASGAGAAVRTPR